MFTGRGSPTEGVIFQGHPTPRCPSTDLAGQGLGVWIIWNISCIANWLINQSTLQQEWLIVAEEEWVVSWQIVMMCHNHINFYGP